MYKIAITIPVRNALIPFSRMIESVYKHTKNFSLFIADDASDERTADYIDSLRPTRIIRHRKQQWFTRTANDLLICSYLAGADYIFLLNSDILIEDPDWVEKFVALMEQNRKTFLVGSVFNKKHKYIRPVLPPKYVTGHCWCIRSKYVKDVGILDEKYIHIESDKEYCYRACAAGYQCIEDSTIKIDHIGGASWGHSLEKLGLVKERDLPPARNIKLLSVARAKQQYKHVFKLEGQKNE